MANCVSQPTAPVRSGIWTSYVPAVFRKPLVVCTVANRPVVVCVTSNVTPAAYSVGNVPTARSRPAAPVAAVTVGAGIAGPKAIVRSASVRA